MSNVKARLASAFLLSVAASVGLIAGNGAARAADGCITEPKADTPQGKHWYYRIERGTGRHCWYLRGEDEASARTPAAEPVASAQPAPATSGNAPARSLADARAEIRAKGPRRRQWQRAASAFGLARSATGRDGPRRCDDGHRSRCAAFACGFATHLALAAGIGRAFDSERRAAGVADGRRRTAGRLQQRQRPLLPKHRRRARLRPARSARCRNWRWWRSAHWRWRG